MRPTELQPMRLSEDAFMALPICGILGPIAKRSGARWRTLVASGWLVGTFQPTSSWSYEPTIHWHRPIIRCARPRLLPRCECCREPVRDDDLDTGAWESRGAVVHRLCHGGEYVHLALGNIVLTMPSASSFRITPVEAWTRETANG